MDTSKEFSKLFEEAEKAVSGIKNERLREIAFEKLVNHLLTESSGNPKNDDTDGKTKVKRRKSKSTSSGGTGSKRKANGPTVWLTELVDEEFFKKPKSSSDILEEFENRSHHLKATDLTRQLQNLCHDRLLRRKKIAPENGGKAVFHWSKW